MKLTILCVEVSVLYGEYNPFACHNSARRRGEVPKRRWVHKEWIIKLDQFKTGDFLNESRRNYDACNFFGGGTTNRGTMSLKL